jgi:hypothetical protein
MVDGAAGSVKLKKQVMLRHYFLLYIRSSQSTHQTWPPFLKYFHIAQGGHLGLADLTKKEFV